MYHPPLHRKLLPWFYGALFLVVAPALIFYTSGYRYNLKKAAIEKYGTLITDSVPGGAQVTIDSVHSGNTTPYAFQEMSPGWHEVRFEKTAYLPWEKNLEIKPERVTFADHVHLWLAQPVVQFVTTGTIQNLSSNPEQDTLAYLQTAEDASTHLVLMQSKGRVSLDAKLPTTTIPVKTITWQADSRAVSLESASGTETLVRFVGKNISTATTAQGFWNGPDFLSFTGSRVFDWNSSNGIQTSDSMATSAREKVGDFTLQKATTSTQFLYDKLFSTRAFSLPAGNWSFNRIDGNTLLLRDGEHWLGVNPRQDQPFLGTAEGDSPRWLNSSNGVPRALFVRDNELWLWQIGVDPELIVRESAPIREVAWHASGDAIFLANDTSIDVLELDSRDGRIRHTLATFDHITDMDVIGKTLYVSGTKNTQTGLWSITVE